MLKKWGGENTSQNKKCLICVELKNVINTCENHYYCKDCLYKIASYLRSDYSCVLCRTNNWFKK
jgi:hypothetical protein